MDNVFLLLSNSPHRLNLKTHEMNFNMLKNFLNPRIQVLVLLTKPHLAPKTLLIFILWVYTFSIGWFHAFPRVSSFFWFKVSIFSCFFFFFPITTVRQWKKGQALSLILFSISSKINKTLKHYSPWFMNVARSVWKLTKDNASSGFLLVLVVLIRRCHYCCYPMMLLKWGLGRLSCSNVKNKILRTKSYIVYSIETEGIFFLHRWEGESQDHGMRRISLPHSYRRKYF